MTFEKVVVIDCKGHLVGRLASVIAKELLKGQKIVAVRCEDLEISGSLPRNKVIWEWYLRKRMNTNPRRGPYHYKAPAKMLWRAVRGMLPRKTERGKIALARLQTFEGVPPPFDKQRRVVVPEAIKVLRLRPGRKSTHLGTLAQRVGWKNGAVVKSLEEKRKVKSQAYHLRKKALLKLKTKALQNAKNLPSLSQFGF
eukprot:TRINITY_DN31460_c0_g1_i1.p1 TRINITY_DN31460_c0_g1~~TRINITY_DN31460_c0_g1_i1.p1  ORF type:complete len:197 (-),score=92.35 TRINITY_DN31460_c0_g1_i1:149-739(-)